MPAVTVDLTGPLAEFLQQEVARGAYPDVGAAVADAVTLLRREREEEADWARALEDEIRIGLDDADAGDFVDEPIEAIAARVKQRLRSAG